MSKKLLAVAILFTFFYHAQAQLTGIKNIPGDYPDLESAISALNSQGVGAGGVTLNLLAGNPQTAPIAGYIVGGSGSLVLTTASQANPIIIEGNGNTITAAVLPSDGKLNNFVFLLHGADWVTLEGFTIQENPVNANTTIASNSMTEWGIALLYVTTTNGAQNNTILNNTISLNRQYGNSFGVYSNTCHALATVTTSARASSATGANSYNKVWGNTISNVKYPVCFQGSDAGATTRDVGNDIGGNAVEKGNTLTNWGSAATSSAYNQLTTTTWGIWLSRQGNFNISYNTITSAVLSNAAETRGIYAFTDVASSNGSTINNNTINVNNAVSTSFIGIDASGSNTSGNLAVNYNTLSFNIGTSTSIMCGIEVSGNHNYIDLSYNVFKGITINAGPSAASFYAMYTSANAITSNINMSDNRIGTTDTYGVEYLTTTTSTFYGFHLSSSQTNSATVSRNDIRRVYKSTAGNLTGKYILCGSRNQTISDNTFTQLEGKGITTFIDVTGSVISSQTITANRIVDGFTCSTGTITCITTGGSLTSATAVITHADNDFSGIIAPQSIVNGFNTAEYYANVTCRNNVLSNWTCASAIAINETNPNNTTGIGYRVFENTISNISASGDITGIITTGYNGEILQNTLTGLSSTGGDVIGIKADPLTSIQVTKNTISNCTSTAGILQGVAVGAYQTAFVSGNRIFNLHRGNTTSSVLSGIYVSRAGTNYSLICNNYVANLTAECVGTDVIRGINVVANTANATTKIYFNTVVINATPPATGNFGTTGIYHQANATSTTGKLDLRNNIVINKSTPQGTGLTIAFRRSTSSAGTLANYSDSSNNNLFYAGTPSASRLIYYDGSASSQTITQYRSGIFTAGTIAPRDGASVSEDVSFLSLLSTSPDFLRINSSVSTIIESGGAIVPGVSTDYYGAFRAGNPNYTGAGTNPDMGAEEGEFFNGIATAPLVTFTPPAKVHCLNVAINASFTSNTGINTTTSKPRLYYKKKNEPNLLAPTNDNTSAGWKFVETTSTTNPYAFPFNESLLSGGFLGGDTIHYFIVSRENSASGIVGISQGGFSAVPASTNLTGAAFPITGTLQFFDILPRYAGTYRVGKVSSDFQSLTKAGTGFFDKINNGTVTGDITLLVDTTILSENGAVALNEMVYGCGVTRQVTIKPDIGIVAEISGSKFDEGLIRLNGADNVVIDGSNNNSSQRHLTIVNKNIGGPVYQSIAIRLISGGVGKGCTNVTIKNCNISTGTTGEAVTNSFGIDAYTAGADHDNVSILNNSFTAVASPLRFIGTSSTSSGGIDNLKIIGNSISAISASSTSNTNINGIFLSNCIGSDVSKNTISIESASNSSAYYEYTGIYIGSGCSTITVTGNNITKIKNNIDGSSIGLLIGTGNSNSNILVANNVLGGVNGKSGPNVTMGTVGIGIGWAGGTAPAGGIRVLNNTVVLSGSMINNSNGSISAALGIYSTASALDIRNNVFVNRLQNAGTGSTKAYGIYSLAIASKFDQINHNDYYTPESQGVLGYLSTSDRPTLTDWRNATGKDQNSINADPQFIGEELPAPFPGSPLYNSGTPLPEVPYDITGVLRNMVSPTIGAYENGADTLGPNIYFTPIGTVNCTAGGIDLTATIQDVSGVDQSANYRPRLYFRKRSEPNALASANNASSPGWKWVTASMPGNNQYSFNIDYTLLSGGLTGNDTIEYFIVAQDLVQPAAVSLANGNFSLMPANVALTANVFPVNNTNWYSVQSTYAGLITVGKSTSNFQSLSTPVTGLFAKLNAGVISGDITIVLDTTYLPEPGTIALQTQNFCGSDTFKIIIRPALGVQANFTRLMFKGVKNLVIDGSDGAGSQAKRIAAGVFEFTGFNGVKGRNIDIKNCRVGIISSSDQEHLTIRRNLLQKIQHAYGDSVNILNNQLESPGAPAISLRHSAGNKLVSNNINIPGTNYLGIHLDSGCVRTTVSGNYIKTTGNFGRVTSIAVTTASPSSDILIVNNILSHLSTNAENWGSGISIGVHPGTLNQIATGGVSLFFNSIAVHGSDDGSVKASAVLIGSDVASLTLKNNHMTGEYGVYSNSNATAFSDINYNNYGGSTFLNYLSGTINSLAAWRTATAQDVNSIAVPAVGFPNPYASLIGAGIPLTGINTDINQQPRSVSAPTIGALETADVEMPDYICPDPVVVTGTCSGYLPDLSDIIVTDNSTPVPLLSIWQQPSPGTFINSTGITPVTIAVEDMSGNVRYCTVNYDLKDDIAPVIISCPSPAAIVANTPLPDYRNNFIATDNCSFLKEQYPAPGTLLPAGTHNLLFIAKDNYGNQNSCSIQLNVVEPCSFSAGNISGPSNICEYLGTGRLATYTITGNDIGTCTWSITGASASTYTIVSGQGTNSITLQMTATFPASTLKVVVASACDNSTVTKTMSLYKTLPALSSITGLQNVCAYAGTSQTVTYSVLPNAAFTSYQWLMPNSTMQIMSGQGSPAIQVRFSNPVTTGSIQVRGVSPCGNTAYKSYSIAGTSPAKPVMLSAEANACPFINRDSIAWYRVKDVSGALFYKWIAPAGMQIVRSGNNIISPVSTVNSTDPFIGVKFTSAFSLTQDILQVSSGSNCGVSLPLVYTVKRTIPAVPALSGPTDVSNYIVSLANPTGSPATYKFKKVSGAHSYTWTLPNGVTQLSRPGGEGTANDTIITVRFETSFRTSAIKVKSNSGCGSSAEKSLTVKCVISATPGTISGMAYGCAFVEYDSIAYYSINPVSGALYYKWKAPAGAMIVSTGDDAVTPVNSIYTTKTRIGVKFYNAFTTTNDTLVRVWSGTNCGLSGERTYKVNRTLSSKPSGLEGPTNACFFINADTIVTYKIGKTSRALFYRWSVPAGCSIVRHGNTDISPESVLITTDTSIGVRFFSSYPSGTQYISVSSGSNCGFSIPATRTVTKLLPGKPGTISGPTDVTNLIVSYANVNGTPATYTIKKVTTAASYEWALPAGVTQLSRPGGVGTANDTIIIVRFESSFTTASVIRVRSANGCGYSEFRDLSITCPLPAKPGSITGKNNACPFIDYDSIAVYKISPVTGITRYKWTAPAGALIVKNGSQTISPVTTLETSNTEIGMKFNGNFVSGSALKVASVNKCGSGTASSYTINRTMSAMPGTITGPTNICDYVMTSSGGGQVIDYKIRKVANATSYDWYLSPDILEVSRPGGAGSINDTFIRVKFLSTFASGSIKVRSRTGCGASAYREISFFCTPRIPCNSLSVAGGQGTTIRQVDLGNTPGPVTVSWDMYTVPDTMILTYRGIQLLNTGPVSYTGSFTFNHTVISGQSNVLTITMKGPIGTGWEYTVSCPGTSPLTNKLHYYDKDLIAVSKVYDGFIISSKDHRQDQFYDIEYRHAGTGDWKVIKGVLLPYTIRTQADIQVKARKATIPISLNNVKTDINGLTIFPNPASHTLNIRFEADKSEKYMLTLVNAAGSQVFSKTYTSVSGLNHTSIPVINYPRGLYILHVRRDKEAWPFRVLLQ